MEKIINKLKSLNPAEIEPNLLKNVLSTFDFSSVDYMKYLNAADFDNYHRVTLLDEPLKVFLTVWPSEFQLSTHQHNNFWGYMAVLKGLLTETFFVYDHDEAQLACHPPKSYRKGEVIFEPLNVIHHIQNPSPSKPLVTAHFYFPTVYSYDGVLIFDIRRRRIAELNEKAPYVSWTHPADFYRRFEEDAFTVINLW